MLSFFASFRAYALSSLLLTTAVISHAAYSKRFFYRIVVHLANSKLAILAIANMALVLVLFIWRIIQAIFLGPLRFRERERLHIRARDAVIESCLAISIFREDFDATFAALVVTLLLYKSIHWLANDRVDYLEEQPLAPRRAHVRTVSLLLLLSTFDIFFSAKVIKYVVHSNRKTMFVLFAFEFTVLAIEIIGAFFRYLFLVIDMSMDGRWERKGLFSFYAELLSDLSQLIICIVFSLYLQFNYSFPFHLMRELYVTFWKFQRRFVEFLRYRQIIATMDERFPDATEEELNEGDRTCIICRDEMQSAKKLSCGHMFHSRCLQNWLKRQLSCPTCRATIREHTSANNNNNNANNNNNVNNRNNNANANANNGAVPAVGQQQARGRQNPVNAGARLLNIAYQRWNQFMVEAGAGVRRRAQNAQQQAPPQQRPRQNNHLNGHVFLHGPNAIAHMEFRARRRGAWPNPVAPQMAATPAEGDQAANPMSTDQRPPAQGGSLNQAIQTQRNENVMNRPGQASASNGPRMEGDGGRPPNFTSPQYGDVGRRLPLDRLLAIQEQLRWLTDEVQELIIDTTDELVSDTASAVPPIPSGISNDQQSVSNQGQASNAEVSATNQEASNEVISGQASSSTSVENRASTLNVSHEETQEQDQSDSPGTTEANEIRQRRIQYLERRAQG